jgi:polyisoprenoid-binding protein YceI
LVVSNIFSATYKADDKISTINFSATKFMFVGVDGSFKKFQGKIEVVDKKLISISGTVDVLSIFTDNDERDTHLKADDYFYEKKYPKIKIETISVKSNILVAKVTIKGIVKNIKFNIDKFIIKDDKIKLLLSSTIDRQQFMLNGSMSAIMSDDVDISVKLSANKI